MRIHHRLARLEDRLQVGTNRDGSCRYCTGRNDLGRIVVFDQFKDDFPTPKPEQDATPTPCPRCGKDMNTHIIIHRVDMIAERRAEGGWIDANAPIPRDSKERLHCSNERGNLGGCNGRN